MTLTHRLLAAVTGFMLLLALFVTAGAKLGLAAIVGLVVGLAIWLRPMWGLAATIVTGVSIPNLVSVATLGTPVSITQAIALLTVGSWIHWSMTRRIGLTWTPSIVVLIGFIVLTVASAILQPDKLQGLQGASVYIRALLFVMLVAGLGYGRENVNTIALTVIAAITLSVILSMSEYVLNYELPSAGTERRDMTGTEISTFSIEDSTAIKRVSGGTGNYNWMAYTVAIGLPLCLWLWVRARRGATRILVAAIGLLSLLVVALTYTRSGFIGLAAAGGYLVYRRRIPLWIPIVLLGVATVTAPVWIPDRFVDRMLSVEYLKKGTTTIRRDFIIEGARMIKERPLFGYGYAQFGPSFLERSDSSYVPRLRNHMELGGGTAHGIRAHNLYIELAVDYGLVGLGAFLTIIWLTYRDLTKIERFGDADQAWLAVTIKAGLIAFLICGIFGNINVMKLPWVLIGLTAAQRRSVLGH